MMICVCDTMNVSAMKDACGLADIDVLNVEAFSDFSCLKMFCEERTCSRTQGFHTLQENSTEHCALYIQRAHSHGGHLPLLLTESCIPQIVNISRLNHQFGRLYRQSGQT